jgi:hypothetical protein
MNIAVYKICCWFGLMFSSCGFIIKPSIFYGIMAWAYLVVAILIFIEEMKRNARHNPQR